MYEENEVQNETSPIQTLPQTQPVVKSPTNWTRIILLTILVLVVASGLVFVGIILLKKQVPNQQPTVSQPTSLPSQKDLKPTAITENDLTVDWKTYANSEYNFSFKYPTDFVNKAIGNTSFILSVGNQDYWLTLKVDSDLSKYTNEIEDIKELFDTKAPNVDIKSVEPYTAYLRSMQTSGGEFSFFRTAIIPTDSLVIELSLSPKDENSFVSTEEIVDQILSTFKFLK